MKSVALIACLSALSASAMELSDVRANLVESSRAILEKGFYYFGFLNFYFCF
jgi:hypothetical protein